MVRECVTEGNKKLTQKFDLGTDHLEDQVVDGKIILTLTLMDLREEDCEYFNWNESFKIGSVAG